ncbi:MAG: hypothetical protein ACTHK2_14265 [Dokdonella sp.]|uniref:hypothetical protein n=1 Tax=Dokdonella sp. TaxID=2291710 RepID=UPI003F7FB78A
MHRLPSILLAAAVLAGCATDKMRSKETILDQTLHSYGATIRWGDVSQALSFIDPKVLAEHPPSQLDLERFKQVRITGYSEQPIVPVGEDEVRQVVQIELANVNTQSVRSIVDRQVWKYDEAAKRWWLTTGLPDIARHE